MKNTTRILQKAYPNLNQCYRLSVEVPTDDTRKQQLCDYVSGLNASTRLD
jgi:hypothetical protein